MVGTVPEALKHIKADLAQVLDAPTILALCREVGYPWRPRLLDPVTTVHLFILQILHGNTACSHLPHLAGQRFTASAYCQARTRLPLGVWQQLLRRTTASLDQTTQDAGRWRGHRTFLVDGSSFSMSDTPELQEHFGQPGGQRPGCGFPVAHLLALFHTGTGFLMEVVADPWHTHDMARVTSIHPTLRPTDQLVEWVKPMRPPVHPPAWMTPDLFAAFPAMLCVRELRYHGAQAGFRTQTVTLVTTLLEADLYPADALADLYSRRWQVEISQLHYGSRESLSLAAA